MSDASKIAQANREDPAAAADLAALLTLLITQGSLRPLTQEELAKRQREMGRLLQNAATRNQPIDHTPAEPLGWWDRLLLWWRR